MVFVVSTPDDDVPTWVEIIAARRASAAAATLFLLSSSSANLSRKDLLESAHVVAVAVVVVLDGLIL